MTYLYDRPKSLPLSDGDKKVALWLHERGFPNHRIAALFDVNQGRISEALHELYTAD